MDKKTEDVFINNECSLCGISSPFGSVNRQRHDLMSLAYNPCWPDGQFQGWLVERVRVAGMNAGWDSRERLPIQTVTDWRMY